MEMKMNINLILIKEKEIKSEKMKKLGFKEINSEEEKEIMKKIK